MIRVLQGHCIDVLRTLPSESVQSCITSPPYFQLRRYLDPSDPMAAYEIGQEATPEEFIGKLVDVFREVKRVLRPDATVLINIGDSYAGSGKGPSTDASTLANGHGNGAKRDALTRQGFVNQKSPSQGARIGSVHGESGHTSGVTPPPGYKAKDLYGIPWMLAFALRADGWYLRGDYIWHKPAPMPESVTDRCTRSHEYIFHLSKSARYFWNVDAIRDVSVAPPVTEKRSGMRHSDPERFGLTSGMSNPSVSHPMGSNKRSVWTINTAGYAEAHFATFPPDLAELMVKATTREGDTVLDPFGGAMTTALAADRLGRNAVAIELNPEYVKLGRRRLYDDAPLFFREEMVSRMDAGVPTAGESFEVAI